MNIYENIGLSKVINASGKMTALGVSKVSDTVVEKMKDAGQNFVVIDSLINRAGEKISSYTGGEDSCVTSSASAGISLSIAGLITKGKLDLIEQMPNSHGLKNKVLIQKGHMVNYGAPVETMIRLGGGVPKEFGHSNDTKVEHLIGAIDENVIALIYVKSHHCVQKGMLSIEEMIKVSKQYNVPLIIDAAAEENLTKYINLGADLVIYSGAKAICAPASGFVTGKKIYINNIKAQYKGIGRAMKIGKMAIIGLLQAIDEYANLNSELVIETQKKLSNLLIEKLKDEKKVSSKMVQDEAGRNIYRVQISLNKELTNISGKEFLQKLKDGDVQIHVRKHYSNLGIVNVDMRALTESDIAFIAQKIKRILN